ncbi:MAG: hypothetical protein GTN53_09740 [Candidatus Aminicenantes bacterium]|nr:hypothetical protein [Candidatus Aminicenantes bacterium]NIQ67091.1 hypothetical protein [Candidatus Aminicenantes bacterium]NIT22773.1 hypothetical protein [Candidatus Aminicenantes bacterium]
MNKIKNVFFGLSLFYLTLYIPLAFMTYFPVWYTFNCHLHPNFNIIGLEKANQYIHELTGFFMHKDNLTSGWTYKEKLHLAEVRNLLDIMALIAFFCLILFIVTFNRKKLPGIALFNLIIIFSLLILLPFFNFFWVKIFHPLLFKNNFWRNYPLDRSFYIMPGVFFKHSMIFLISSASIINAIIWSVFREKVRIKKGSGEKSYCNRYKSYCNGGKSCCNRYK